jgi:hypothetical protein
METKDLICSYPEDMARYSNTVGCFPLSDMRSCITVPHYPFYIFPLCSTTIIRNKKKTNKFSPTSEAAIGRSLVSSPGGSAIGMKTGGYGRILAHPVSYPNVFKTDLGSDTDS